MEFYKVRVKTGHVGKGCYREIEVGCIASSCMRAVDAVKKMPMVKHTNSKVLSNVKLSNESEYIALLLNCPYSKLKENEIDVNNFDNIAKRVDLLKTAEFKTDDGLKLIAMCEDYLSADEDRKKQIVQDYRAWAFPIVEQYNKQQEESFGW